MLGCGRLSDILDGTNGAAIVDELEPGDGATQAFGLAGRPHRVASVERNAM